MRFMDDVFPSFPKSNDLRIYPEKKIEREKIKRPRTPGENRVAGGGEIHLTNKTKYFQF